MFTQRFCLALGLAICASVCASSNDHLRVFSSEKVLHRIPKVDESLVTADGIAQMILGSLGLPTAVIGSESELEVPDVFNTAKMNVLVVVENSDGVNRLEIPNSFSNVNTYEVAVGGNYLSIPHILSVSSSLKYGNDARHLCVAKDICKFDGSDIAGRVEQDEIDRVVSQAREIAPSLADNIALMQEIAKVHNVPKVLERTEGKKNIVTIVLSTLRDIKGDAHRTEAANLVNKVVTDLLSTLHGSYGDSLIAEVLMLAGELPVTAGYSPILSDVLQLQRRLLTADNSTANVTTSPKNETDSSPPTADDIARFQVILWTSVLLAVALFCAIGSLITMDVGRDSLLYAKFQTDGTHRKAD